MNHFAARACIALSLLLATCKHDPGGAASHDTLAAQDMPHDTIAAVAVFDEVWANTSLTEPLDEEDPRTKDLQPYFVTAPHTSLCPSKEAAMTRECGHSVEFGGTSGYRLTHGERLSVVPGRHNPDAHTLPVIRYMVQGLTPGFVPRADVATQPDLSHRAPFLLTLKPSVRETISAAGTTQEELLDRLAASEEGLFLVTDVKGEGMTRTWRSTDEGVGFELALDERAPPLPVEFSLDMEESGFPAFLDAEYFPEDPNKYMCDAHYCDQIDLIFTKKERSSPPKLLHVIDRFGAHTLR